MLNPKPIKTASVAMPLAAALTALLLSACATPGGPAPAQSAAPSLSTSQVRIIRTTHGIPHVTAGNMEMLAYGMAYAHAQDNICLSADHMATLRGERSKHFGPAASGVLGVRTLPNAVIDAFIQSHMDDAKLSAAWQNASANGKAAALGYVAGYNRYLADQAANLPAECKGKPWVQPMTLTDYYRGIEVVQVQAGAGALADAIAGAQPPAIAKVSGAQPPAIPKLSGAQPPEMKTALLQAPQHESVTTYLREAGVLDSPLGSNAWAFGKDTTANGRGMLLGNPHYPWVGPSRFYQMRSTIPGEFDVMGAALGWAAMPQIGFTKDVAWSHTVSTGKRFTLHELKLVPGKPTSYLIDGQEEAMQAKPVNVGGKVQTIWHTRFGPVMVLPRAGLVWSAERAYALQDANAGSLRGNDVYVQIAKAKNAAELRTALGGLGTPFVNTIAADRDGNAMYADVSGVPDLDTADLQRCAPSRPAAALLGAAGLVVLDGSRSECNWKRDATSPAPGLIAPARMPVAIRSDWVHNSNDSFFYSHPDQKWPAISPLMGDDVLRRARTRSGVLEIQGMLAKGKASLAGIQAQLFENNNLLARQVLPDLLASCPQAPNDAAKTGCAALAKFQAQGMRSDASAPAAPLFREFWRVASAIPQVYREPYDKARSIATPTGLRMSDAAVATKVWEALAGAVVKLQAAGFAADASLGLVQRAVFDPASNDSPLGIALHGGDDSEGVLNNVGDRGRPGITARGIRIDYGTSYVQTVSFDERGPVAQALLVYGQSAHAGSPHQLDQLKAYAEKRWPQLPFHPEDVERQRIGPVLVLEKR